MYNYTPLTNMATSMPAIVARSVIASRNSDPPPRENLTNTAMDTSSMTIINKSVKSCQTLRVLEESNARSSTSGPDTVRQ